jgi:hypothetical protein
LKSLIASIIALLSLCEAGWSQKTLAEYDWKDLAQKGALSAAAPASVEAGGSLKVANTNDGPLQVTLLTIKNPTISAAVYAITGKVKYESVQGEGFLEMWNYFPPAKPGLPEEKYFSRTLDDSGPMGKITDSSDWREFELPFDRTGTSNAPVMLQFNLVLKGHGTVYLGPLKLVEYPGAKSAGAMFPGAWWSDTAARWWGGLGGGLIGCLGSLTAWLAYKGKARRFVVAVLASLTGLGVLCGVAALVALAGGQPYAVWFPLLLGAVLLLSICPYRLREYQKKYEELELRRMTSLDASGA